MSHTSDSGSASSGAGDAPCAAGAAEVARAAAQTAGRSAQSEQLPAYDAIVVAGGGARRLGGSDKPAVTVGARSLLNRVLAGCRSAADTVVVGPRRPTYRRVCWAREHPPGGGPLAALHTGLGHVTQEIVLVVSADLPFLRQELVRELVDRLDGEERRTETRVRGQSAPAQRGFDPAPRGVSATVTAGHGTARRDGPQSAPPQGGSLRAEGVAAHAGRDQPLLAAYRTESLRRELALLHTEYGHLAGLPLRLLLPELRLRRITTWDAPDCDTWQDIAAARARIREHDTVLDEWTAAVTTELGIDLDVDTAAILDLARDAAHGVTRPAAPLTTFLAGYAAAQRGGSPEDVAEVARKAAALAERWAAEQRTQPDGEQAGEGPPSGTEEER